MSLKAAFHRSLCQMVREGRRDELRRLVSEWGPVVDAFQTGDQERGRELRGDLEARLLLRQVFPDWEWCE